MVLMFFFVLFIQWITASDLLMILINKFGLKTMTFLIIFNMIIIECFEERCQI